MIYTLIIKNSDGQTSSVISFSSVRSFSESLGATTTDNVVEYGFPVSDHMLVSNITFDLDVIVTGFSVFDENLELFWNGSDFTTNSPDQLTTQNAHLLMRKQLKDLILNRIVFSLLITEDNSFVQDINTKEAQLRKSIVDEYINCVCTSLTLSESEATTGAIFAKLNIKQIRSALVKTRELEQGERVRQIDRIAPTPTVSSQNSSDVSKGVDSDDNADLSKETKGILDGEKQGKLPKSAETGLSQAEINRRQVESNAIATGHIQNKQRLAEAARLDAKREAGDFR
ncbi:TPA: hypothetical protein NNW70_004176 [Salmonella enterica]|nr:hypothetical protein [Salmonella enterica]HCH9607886.1 hypothetical protein [Salmonella enterica]HDI5000180.1 hypothetical protein [Salmonella enterica]